MADSEKKQATEVKPTVQPQTAAPTQTTEVKTPTHMTDVLPEVPTGSGAVVQSGNETHAASTVDAERKPAVVMPGVDVRKEMEDVRKGAEEAQLRLSYADQIRALDEARRRYAGETEEQRRKRERQQKAKRIVGAVSDGLRSLSNLVFTTRYAPNMYDHEKDSMVKPTMEAIGKAKKEREANADRYMDLSLKIGDLRQKQQQGVAALRQQREQMRLARERADREKADEAARRAREPYELRKAAAEAKRAETVADWTERQQKADVERKNRSGGTRGGGSKSTAMWSALDKDGVRHDFPATSTANAHSIAGARGWTVTGQVVSRTSTKTDEYGDTSTTRNESRTTTDNVGGGKGKKSPTGGGGRKKSPTA